MLDLKNLSTAGRQRRCGAELSTRALRMRLLRLLGYSLRGRRILCADRRCCAELTARVLRMLSTRDLRLRLLGLLSMYDRRSGAELSPHAHAAGWGIKSTDGGPDECGRCSTR